MTDLQLQSYEAKGKVKSHSLTKTEQESKIDESSLRENSFKYQCSEIESSQRTLPKNQSPRKSLYSTNTDKIPQPQEPVTLQESGLSIFDVGDLILKLIYLRGNFNSKLIAHELKLPFKIICETLIFLRDETCIQFPHGKSIELETDQFSLTDYGRNRAQEAFERNRYIGPAPVSLYDYSRQCEAQRVSELACREIALKQALADLVISDELINELGPAICSGESIFLHGPAGNGKSQIAKGLGKFLSMHGGDIYIPYAIQTEGTIITLFDPLVHHPTDNEDQIGNEIGQSNDNISHHDRRWRKIQRPIVVTGAELNLEMLDLYYHEVGQFYSAPLHIKANCGVYLIDDFGRQSLNAKDLLNRWIQPLEERSDYLTLNNGKKISFPSEQLAIFSTNLDLKEEVDDAFLRRIRHKIEIKSPTREEFATIFKKSCYEKQLKLTPDILEFLLNSCYNSQILPKSSDPQNLLEIAESICRFKNEPFVLTQELINDSSRKHFSISEFGSL